jgi:hypothetical protein
MIQQPWHIIPGRLEATGIILDRLHYEPKVLIRNVHCWDCRVTAVEAAPDVKKHFALPQRDDALV